MRIWNLFGPAVVLAFGLSITAGAEAGDDSTVDVKELVKEVIASEDWIHDVDTFYLRVDSTSEQTEQKIELHRAAELKEFERRRAEMRKKFPDMDQAVFDKQPSIPALPATTHDHLEIAFDDLRIRKDWDVGGTYQETRIWDGTQACVSHGSEPRSVFLMSEPSRAFDQALSMHLCWLRTRAHGFWWSNSQNPAITIPAEEIAEGATLVGRLTFRGRDCFVIEFEGGKRRWYVGTDEHRLFDIDLCTLDPDADVNSIIHAIAEKHGASFGDFNEFQAWRENQPDEVRERALHEYQEELRSLYHLRFRMIADDFQEVHPGCWFPALGVIETFSYGGFFADTPLSTKTIRLAEIRVNEPLDDSLFQFELAEGVEVSDRRFDAPISYRYRLDMTQTEIDEHLAEARDRQDRRNLGQEQRDPLIGADAFPFPEAIWVNSEPLTWEDLRGKVVILSFFATWCGPCRVHQPFFREYHANSEETGVFIIGVHVAGTPIEEVRRFAKSKKLEYPICQDVFGGQDGRSGHLSEQYPFDGIPYEVLVDAEGRIVAHGRDLEAMYKRALQLVP